MNPFFVDVCDCDDNERLDKISANQTFGSFVHAPFHARKRSCCIENVLAIVQIQYRITPARKTPVAARQINQNVAPVAENLRPKRAVPFDVAGKRVFAHWKKETLR